MSRWRTRAQFVPRSAQCRCLCLPMLNKTSTWTLHTCSSYLEAAPLKSGTPVLDSLEAPSKLSLLHCWDPRTHARTHYSITHARTTVSRTHARTTVSPHAAKQPTW